MLSPGFSSLSFNSSGQIFSSDILFLRHQCLSLEQRLKQDKFSVWQVYTARVTTDKDGQPQLQSRQWASLETADCTAYKDTCSLDTVYIALTREAPADRPEKPTTYRMRGNIRQGVDMVIVPEEEVAALEAQGSKSTLSWSGKRKYNKCLHG
uniref:Uncharacterized protein n=1 Tax=Photinus pyralis TaxID=7054 RepID=A0A1Y1MD48_PHOPY